MVSGGSPDPVQIAEPSVVTRHQPQISTQTLTSVGQQTQAWPSASALIQTWHSWVTVPAIQISLALVVIQPLDTYLTTG